MGEKRISVWVQQFKDRRTLMLQWIDPETGRRKSKSSGTDDPAKAETKRADLEYELNHGHYQEPSKLDWEHFRQMFEEEYVAGLRPRSAEKYTTVLDVFEQIILVNLKAALNWTVNQKFLPSLPEFPRVKVPKKKPQPISPDDFEKLLAQAPDDLWRAFLLCGWWCGLRLSEARHLRWEPVKDMPWVDFAGERIVLPAVFAKSDEDQWVPLHPLLCEALKNLPRTGLDVFPFRSRKGGGALTRNGITNRVIHMAKKAGIKLSMHRLRKGFGCRVAKKLGKGNAPIMHRLMRHSSMQVTMDYYASVDDALHDAINDLT